MKYNYLINAKAMWDFNECLKEKFKDSKLKEKDYLVNVKDMMVMEYLKDFIASGKMIKIELEKGTFYWINQKRILRDNPFLELKSTGSISKIITKLVMIGLLDKYIHIEDGNKLYFKITNLYHDCFIECNIEKYIAKKTDKSFPQEKGSFPQEKGSFPQENNYNKQPIINTIDDSIIKEPEPFKFFWDWLKEVAPMSLSNKNKIEMVFMELRSNYTLEEIQKVIKWAMNNEFWSDKLLNNYSLKNNFEKIKLQMDKKQLNNTPTFNSKGKKQPTTIIDPEWGEVAVSDYNWNEKDFKF